MSEYSQPADVPRATNVHGTPSPPSGEHPASSAPTVVIQTGGKSPAPEPTGQPAPNIHK